MVIILLALVDVNKKKDVAKYRCFFFVLINFILGCIRSRQSSYVITMCDSYDAIFFTSNLLHIVNA